jgi:uncharacterized protein YchJ
MRMCWKRILLVLAVFTVALWGRPVLSADKEQVVPDEGALEVILMRHKAVRDALHLTDDQAKEIKEFATRQWKKAQAMADLREEQRREKFDAMAKENHKFLRDTLKPEQHRRLHQIAIQVAGLLMVTHPDVAKEIHLTAEQKKKAEHLQEEARKEFRKEIHSEATEGRETRMEEMRQANRKRLMGLLTPEQKAKWKKMAGEKFTGDLSKD